MVAREERRGRRSGWQQPSGDSVCMVGVKCFGTKASVFHGDEIQRNLAYNHPPRSSDRESSSAQPMAIAVVTHQPRAQITSSTHRPSRGHVHTPQANALRGTIKKKVPERTDTDNVNLTEEGAGAIGSQLTSVSLQLGWHPRLLTPS